MNKTTVLASSSPRRIEMLQKSGFNPIIHPADIDETLPKNILPRDAVMFLSLKKALSVAELFPDNTVIIAADTVVSNNGILGKPSDEKDAEKMLMSLSGHPHEVLTGVTVLETGTPHIDTFCDVTKVFVADFSSRDISRYVMSDEPYDKAGGYAIQGWFGRFITEIDGDYDNVVGLPLRRLTGLLQEKYI